MAYHKKRIKDNELPSLLFLLDLILDNFFGKEYWELKDEDYRHLLSESDDINAVIRLPSITTIKDIFKLIDGDNRYRPNYTNINCLLFGLYKKKVSLQRFLKDNKSDIDAYFESLNYVIQEVNPEKEEIISVASKTQTLNLGTQTGGIQINLDQGAIAGLLKSVAFRFGDLLSEQQEISHLPTMMREYEKERTFRRIHRTEEIRQTNSENIIAKATQFTKDFKFSDHIIDQDWMSEFFNISQDCSNETMQYLWAKILASEVDTPGAFSRRTLHAIKLLDAEEASIFTLLCNCLWETYPGETRSDLVLFKNSSNEGKYSDATWGFDSELLQHLEDLGLVHTTYMIIEKDAIIDVIYFDKKHQLGTDKNAIEVEIVRLSSVGTEIYEVVRASKNDSYYQFTLEFMKQEGIFKK